MTLETYLNICAVVIGLCIGSFLNVVGLRLLKGEDFCLKPSYCPKCDNKIKWYDNIPLLSFLILGGKCRFCKEKISFQYPFTELFTGILFGLLVFYFGITLKTLFLAILCSLMIVIAITDFKEQAVYDSTSYPIIVLGLLYSWLNLGSVDILGAIIAAALGFIIFEAIARMGGLFVGERIFGEGDSVIAAGLGAWFGIKALLGIIVLSFLIQVISGLPLVLKNMYKDKDYKSIMATLILILCIALASWSKYLLKAGMHEYSIFISIFVIISSLFSSFVIIRGLKEKKSYTMLPFGPALIFSGMLYIFFADSTLTYLIRLFT